MNKIVTFTSKTGATEENKGVSSIQSDPTNPIQSKKHDATQHARALSHKLFTTCHYVISQK